MKTGKLSSMLVLSSIVLGSMITLNSCDKDNDAVDNRVYTINGNANGSQLSPFVPGTGSGTMTGTYDPASRQFNYTTTWSGLTGAPTNAGFYGGRMGTSGDPVGTAWTFPGGTTNAGTRTGTMTLTEEQSAELTGGNWYYTYGTSTNPSGEIRGQMTATR